MFTRSSFSQLPFPIIFFSPIFDVRRGVFFSSFLHLSTKITTDWKAARTPNADEIRSSYFYISDGCVHLIKTSSSYGLMFDGRKSLSNIYLSLNLPSHLLVSFFSLPGIDGDATVNVRKIKKWKPFYSFSPSPSQKKFIWLFTASLESINSQMRWKVTSPEYGLEKNDGKPPIRIILFFAFYKHFMNHFIEVIARGSVTAVSYRDDILEPPCLPFQGLQ